MGFKFKVGEIVKVKPLSEINNRSSGPGFVDEMVRFIDKEVRVDGMHYSSYKEESEYEIYTIEGWNWKAEWLKKVEFFNNKDFEI